jgi:mevalonate kinase
VALAGALLRVRALVDQQELKETAAVGNREQDPDREQEQWRPSEEMLVIVNGWAFASEMVIHGDPSGLDNTTSCYGGALKYSRASGVAFEKLSKFPALNILLTNTKVPRSTKTLVAGVRDRFNKFPVLVQSILDAIAGISMQFLNDIDQYYYHHAYFKYYFDSMS